MAEELQFTLQKGDIACTENPMALCKAINFIQKLKSKDNKSKYTHSMIITNTTGGTYESKWRISKGHLNSYVGKLVVIFRHVDMNEEAFQKGYVNVHQHDGKIYPGYRLLYFLLPFASKYIHIAKVPVCSELVAKFLYKAGFALYEWYYGITPNDIVSRCRIHKKYIKVFEGRFKYGLIKFAS